MSIWRWISPSFLSLALCVFFLPWIEIRCDGLRKTEDSSHIQTQRFEADRAEAIPKSLPPQRESRPFLTQSGWQSVWGNATNEEGVEFAMQQVRNANAESSRRLRQDAAPLMSVYVACLAIGLACSLALRNDRQRRRVVLLLSAGAALMLGIQMVIGFPLVQEFVTAERTAERQVSAAIITVRYTPWFWTALAATAAAFASSIIDVQSVALRSDYNADR